MEPLTVFAGALLGGVGVAAERLASVWPAEGASRRGPGWRTAALGFAGLAAGATVATLASVPPWALAVHLVALGLMLMLVATDLEQRRLPHLLLDPLCLLVAVFALVNPGLTPLSAAIGAAVGIGVLGGLGLVVRGGVAVGDLWLVAPIGALLGWPAVFIGLFAAAILSAGISLALLVSRRVTMRSYIPFGPFLVAGYLVALVRQPELLEVARRTLFG